MFYYIINHSFHFILSIEGLLPVTMTQFLISILLVTILIILLVLTHLLYQQDNEDRPIQSQDNGLMNTELVI